MLIGRLLYEDMLSPCNISHMHGHIHRTHVDVCVLRSPYMHVRECVHTEWCLKNTQPDTNIYILQNVQSVTNKHLIAQMSTKLLLISSPRVPL